MKTELKKTNSTKKKNDTLFPYQIPRLVGRNVDFPPHEEWSPRQFYLNLERQISSSDIWLFTLSVPVSLRMYAFAYALKQSLNETFETIWNDYFRRKRVLEEEFHFYFIISFKNSWRTWIAFVVTLDPHSRYILFWKVPFRFCGNVWMWISLWNDSSLSPLSAR